MKDADRKRVEAGRNASLVIAATAILWAIATFLGARLEVSQRVLALFDLMALGGFLWGLWMIYNIWRMRRENRRR